MAKTPTKDEKIAEYRRQADQCRADAMDAPTPELQKRLEKDAATFDRLAEEEEERRGQE